MSIDERRLADFIERLIVDGGPVFNPPMIATGVKQFLEIEAAKVLATGQRFPEKQLQPVKNGNNDQPDESTFKMGDFRIQYFNHTITEIIHMPTGQILRRPERESSQWQEPFEAADNKRLLKWAYLMIENACPHVLTETVEGRFFEKRVNEIEDQKGKPNG